MGGSDKQKQGEGRKVIAQNRKAHFDYEITERIEAGICLTGTEVKSLREGKANLKDSYAQVRNGEMFLTGCHITPYRNGTHVNHEAERERKLLLHKREIHRLAGKTIERGLTLVPLSLYFNNGRVKVELGLAQGLQKHDKREVMREREQKREVERAMKEWR
ncbi:MAG: SsrA-binding protein SmpB [Candidatus Schekmanbacteria bacterium]|nr:SsrA-binding protein SmpB [Candidatus Schekmanbacteria bacterium]